VFPWLVAVRTREHHASEVDALVDEEAEGRCYYGFVGYVGDSCSYAHDFVFGYSLIDVVWRCVIVWCLSDAPSLYCFIVFIVNPQRPPDSIDSAIRLWLVTCLSSGTVPYSTVP